MKVMVVDDSRMMRKTVARMLTALGHDAQMAEDGQNCLDEMKKDLPDIILMDWNMPVMDGLEALKAIKVDSSLASAIVVMMTTENTQDKINEALEAGADEYIMKPFDEQVLQEKLESLDGDDFL